MSTEMRARSRTVSAVGAVVTLLVTTFGSSPAASADGDFPPPVSESLVDAYYANFLCRDVDSGSDYWVKRLDRGDKPSDIAWAIARTPEFNETSIDFLYDNYLGREPDRGALYWLDGVSSGRLSLEQVRAGIAASDENFSLSADDAVRCWYDVELGRQPQNPGEAYYWVKRAEAVGRSQAFVELYTTDEAVKQRVTESFQSTLDRNPTPDEPSHWGPRERESHINVPVLIGGTPEYQNRARSLGQDYGCLPS